MLSKGVRAKVKVSAIKENDHDKDNDRDLNTKNKRLKIESVLIHHLNPASTEKNSTRIKKSIRKSIQSDNKNIENELS